MSTQPSHLERHRIKFKNIGALGQQNGAQDEFDPTLCNDENTNTFIESFNSAFGVDRTYPILTLLEGVRRIAMVRHATRQQIATTNGHNQGLKSVSDLAYSSGRGINEIHMEELDFQYLFKLEHVPGIRVIVYEGKDPADYVSEWFSIARCKKAYHGNILPVPNKDQWPHMKGVPTLIPPTMKRSIGRPSRKRRREEGEQQKGKGGGPIARELTEQQGQSVTSKCNTKGEKPKTQSQTSETDSRKKLKPAKTETTTYELATTETATYDSAINNDIKVES
ncbi:Interleukin-22 receptor subunit alpha-1 [Bienertia sinuspersici]